MQQHFVSDVSSSVTQLFAWVASLVALLTSIFWLVVGWRAMRAHEEIAALLREKRERP